MYNDNFDFSQILADLKNGDNSSINKMFYELRSTDDENDCGTEFMYKFKAIFRKELTYEERFQFFFSFSSSVVQDLKNDASSVNRPKEFYWELCKINGLKLL